MLETLRRYIAADWQRFMERLNGDGVRMWVRPADKRKA